MHQTYTSDDTHTHKPVGDVKVSKIPPNLVLNIFKNSDPQPQFMHLTCIFLHYTLKTTNHILAYTEIKNIYSEVKKKKKKKAIVLDAPPPPSIKYRAHPFPSDLQKEKH